MDDFLSQSVEHPEQQAVMDRAYSEIPSPSSFDEAWIKYIIEFHLPKDLEKLLILYMKPLIDLAAKSNLKRAEIPMHLLAYDIIWDEYRIYERKGRYDSRLMVCQEIIRHAFELQLNRSVEGWQGNLIFTRKFDIQHHMEKQKNRFSNFFKNKDNDRGEG